MIALLDLPPTLRVHCRSLLPFRKLPGRRFEEGIAQAMVAVCIAGILFIGIYPNPLIKAAELAVQALK